MLNSMFKTFFTLFLIIHTTHCYSEKWPYTVSSIQSSDTVRCSEYWNVKKLTMHDKTVWLTKQSSRINCNIINSGILYEYLYNHVAQLINITDQKTYLVLSKDHQPFLARSWIDGTIYSALKPNQKNSFTQVLNYRQRYTNKNDTQGFNRITLHALASEPTMSWIVALDTYLCFIDRSDENIIRQNISNKLLPIDGEDIVNDHLAYYALMTFQDIYNTKYSMTFGERYAATLYKNTLETLIIFFSVQDLDIFFNQVFKGCNITQQTHEDLYNEINRYKRNFTYNYFFVKQLIAMINKCLEM